MRSDDPDDEMSTVDIESGPGNATAGRQRNDSHAAEPSTTFDTRGVQMGKSPNGVEMERPDRGLLADQDHQRAIWTSRARRFTSMAMVVDFLTAILALVAGGIINSSAMIGYGLEAFVDMVASILVLWRFWESAETESGARANEDREQRANVLIAFIFVAIAFITSADAIEHLANHKEPENGALIIVFAVITMLVLGAIGCMKLYINRHLHSKALEQDAMASFATAAISVGLLVSASAHAANDNVWWLDSVWAMVVVWTLALYNLPILIKMRWWHKSFWKSWSASETS